MSNSPAKKHFEEKEGTESAVSSLNKEANQEKSYCPFKHKRWFIAGYLLLIIIILLD